jgi:hypothetical protein
MTNAEFRAILDECNFASPEAVSKLVTASYTNVKFNDKIVEKQTFEPLGAYNYFGGLFGKEVWPDGQGMDLIREYATPSHIPFTFSHFVRQSEICDPNVSNACHTTYCEIPEGGRGTLPPFHFFKAGLKTKRDCIAAIRSIKDFRFWAERVINDRKNADDQMMNIFYTMAGLKTAGHKITMQGYRDASGLLRLLPDNDPRNPLQGGLHNYIQEKFPQPNDLNLIVPLTVDTLEGLARYWNQYPKGNHIATGPRGEYIWEFWSSDDWYLAEALRDPDYLEKIKILMPNKMFGGHSNAPGDREVVGQFANKPMHWLPRYAPTNDGQIVAVDSKIGVDIEVGQEFLGSQDFLNAPFGLAMITSGRQGTILSRPTLSTSGAGFPIMPISGDGPWIIRNDYDAVCNEDLNQPYSQKRYEMGFRMDDPEASIAFLYRRRIFQTRPVNECDLAPIFPVETNTIDCDIVTVGCGANEVRESDNIVAAPGPQYVTCMNEACSNGATAAPFGYVIKVDRVANRPGYNSLGCECGAALTLYVYDANGEFVRPQPGTYKSDIKSFPYAKYYIETATRLIDGECIKGVECTDATPTMGNVIDSFEEGDNIVYILDSSIGSVVGDDVSIKYYSSTNTLLGTIVGIVEEYNPTAYRYTVSSANPAFGVNPFEGTASVSVTGV